MKKVLLVQARISEDKKTKERLLFVTFVNLPTKNAQGNIWYPKNDEVITVSCFGEDRAPALFAKLRKVTPGTLCGVTYGVSDFGNKLFVSDVEVLKEVYTEADIYERADSATAQQPATATAEKSKKTATTTDGDIPF